MATSRFASKRFPPRAAALGALGALLFAAAADGAPAPGTLDPSEVVTPAELATIPDPVPSSGTSPPGKGASAAAAAPAPSSADADSAATSSGQGAAWRVQIFASPDLAQARRVAREASEKFGVPFTIEFEGSIYKVRLGLYSSEEEAQALRERAMSEGYPGAFRTQDSNPLNQTYK